MAFYLDPVGGNDFQVSTCWSWGKFVWPVFLVIDMGVSRNRGGPPKSSILIGFSIINHPFWDTRIFGNTHMIVGQKYSKKLRLKN